jgi:hypothetical protein
VRAANWVVLIIGTHLPFWPLYVWLAAGSQAMPTALLTVAATPAFLLVLPLSRRSGRWARIATVLVAVGNTALTTWVMGLNTGTGLFLAPCAALAALLFRRSELWLMLALALLPLGAWYALEFYAPAPLHVYDAGAARSLIALNVASIGVLFPTFGWLQVDIYRRMEQRDGGAPR